jgi:signal transduction histidine kinase
LIHDGADDFQDPGIAAGKPVVVRDGEEVVIQTDPARVRQVLANLVSNAIKYASKGPIAVEAAVRDRGNRTGWVALSVVDSGPGIPADKAEAIFEGFTRLDPGGQQGSGIGLAISRRIARLLGGELEPEGAGSGRSTFTL